MQEEQFEVQPEIPQEPEPAPTFIQRYKKYFWPALITAAVIVAAALVVIFLLRSPGEVEFAGDANLTISVPNQSVSGSEIAYEVLIENVSSSALTSLGLDVFYPSGFEFIDSTPDAGDSEQAFQFENLPAGQTQKLVIVGRLSGSLQELKTLSVKLRYIPENFQSTFEQEASANVVVLAPNLTLSLAGPAQVFAGQTVDYEIELANQSEEVFSDVLVALTHPKEFEYTRTVDAEQTRTGADRVSDSQREVSVESANEILWEVDQILPGQKRLITFSGKLSQTLTGEALLRVEQFLQDAEGQRLSAGRSFVFTKVLSAPLLLEQTVDTTTISIFDEGALTEGKGLRFTVRFQHVGLVGLNNVNISLVFEENIYDFSRFRNDAGNGQLVGSSIRWIPAANPELRVLSPGRSGEFGFTLPIVSSLASVGITNPQVSSRLEFTSEEFPEPVSSQSFEAKIQSTVGLAVSKVVTGGANPPVAGSVSTYRVDIEVTNSVNDFARVLLSASVPGFDTEVDFDSITPDQEKQNLIVEPSPGFLKWQLGLVPALTGFSKAKRTVSFNLTSSSPNLLQNIELVGTDEFTGEEILVDGGDLRAK